MAFVYFRWIVWTQFGFNRCENDLRADGEETRVAKEEY